MSDDNDDFFENFSTAPQDIVALLVKGSMILQATLLTSTTMIIGLRVIKKIILFSQKA